MNNYKENEFSSTSLTFTFNTMLVSSYPESSDLSDIDSDLKDVATVTICKITTEKSRKKLKQVISSSEL